jgi:hypothetical protein
MTCPQCQRQTPRSSLEGERTQVTVLFAELKGSEAIMGALP